MRSGALHVSAIAAILSWVAVLEAREPESRAAKAPWYQRMLPWGATRKSEPKRDEAELVPAVTPSVLRQRAILDWSRRQEVVDRLREIAFQTGDEELRRKADQLNDRIWDTYMKATAGLPQGNVSPEEQILESKLGIDAARSQGSAPSRKSGAQASR